MARVLNKVNRMHNKVFLSVNAQNSIAVLHLNELNIKMFKENVKNFYRNFISYLKCIHTYIIGHYNPFMACLFNLRGFSKNER